MRDWLMLYFDNWLVMIVSPVKADEDSWSVSVKSTEATADRQAVSGSLWFTATVALLLLWLS